MSTPLLQSPPIGLAKNIMPQLGAQYSLIMSINFGLIPLALENFSKINAVCLYQVVKYIMF